MRLPYVVPPSTQTVYETCAGMRQSPGEAARAVRADDFSWDAGSPPPLAECCAAVLAGVFHEINPLNDILQKDRNMLMDFYPADIPLKFSMPLIEDERYWERSFATRWPARKELGVTNWKAKFSSVALQEYLETCSADVFIEEDAVELAGLVQPYIFSLSLWQLQIVRAPTVPVPPEDAIEDECPLSITPCFDHIPLENILKKLTNLVDISLVFGVNNLEDKYDPRYFEFSANDCHSICKGLIELEHIKIFRITRSTLDCVKVKIILQYLLKKLTIEELDFSHCMIGDAGLRAVGGFIKLHTGLRILRLTNNKFGEDGIQGLAYALQMQPAAPLEVLDLKMNIMNANSARMLAASLVRCREKPQNLIVGTCGLRGESAEKMAGLLCLNRGLTDLDLSANDLSGDAEVSLVAALEKNRRILRIDLRNTRISDETLCRVAELLNRNAKLLGKEYELSDVIPPLYLDQPEYLVWDYSPENPHADPGPPSYPPRIPAV